MINCINSIVLPYTNGEPCALVLDSASINKTQQFISYCKTYNIELLHIPPNGTWLLQPNDLAVFNVAKNALRHKQMIESHNDIFLTCITSLSVCINSVNSTAIYNSWQTHF